MEESCVTYLHTRMSANSVELSITIFIFSPLSVPRPSPLRNVRMRSAVNTEPWL